MFPIRLGESKLYSTIQFEGGFGVYKRSVLDSFDCETGADDSGTALNMVQKNYRTIYISEAAFFTFFPNNWTEKVVAKVRMAKQLVQVWIKCLKLLFKRELILPKKIALPEIFLFLFNPPIFMSLIFVTFTILLQYPVFSLFLILPFFIPKSSSYLIVAVQYNFIILLALIALIMRKKYVMWGKANESRTLVHPDVLRKMNLI